ncbi:MAG: ABC transporter permease [Chromatiaceae bacterium]|nr:MAG: ABC transporter permease [Chromatiaceae bacterium]
MPAPPLVRDRPIPGQAPTHLGWLAGLGLAAVTLWLCLRLYAAILLRRGRLDLPAFTAALRLAGLSMLPAMTLVALSVGLILGHQGAQLLANLNLPSLFLLSFVYAIVMEIIPVLVGILVAGRAGVALAVQHSTLTVSGQNDGLLVQGINPIEYTTAPMLLAMLAMSFAFLVWGSLISVSATFVWLILFAGLPPALFAESLRAALGPDDLLQALAKPLVFALVIALIATVNGVAAGRDGTGIARAATGTMIGAVTAILLIDLAFVLWPSR